MDLTRFSSETDGDANNAGFGVTRRWFVYGNGIDEPLIMVVYTDNFFKQSFRRLR